MAEPLFISDPKLTAISNHSDDDDMGNYYDDWENEETYKCPTCRGTGEVNALTAPRDMPYFVASYADCPHCDGTGEI